MRSIPVQLLFNVTAVRMNYALLFNKLRLSLRLLGAAAVALQALLNRLRFTEDVAVNL